MQLWTTLPRSIQLVCMWEIDATAFQLRVHQRAVQKEPDDWKWNFSLLSPWYLRLFSLGEHNHCVWKPAANKRAHTEVSMQPPPTLPTPLQLPPQNHRAAHDIEQSCHPRQPGSHYSGCIYPSTRRKSAFIRPFYRWWLGSLLGMDSISCAVIIKSQCCSNSSVRLYFDWKLQMPLWPAFQNSRISTSSEPLSLFFMMPCQVVLIESSTHTHKLFHDLWNPGVCVFNKTLILPHVLKSRCHLEDPSHHVSKHWGLDQSYVSASRWENYSASELSILKLISALLSDWFLLLRCVLTIWKKKKMHNMQDQVGEMLGHIGSCYNIRHGLVLLSLLLMDF